jgi:hypothetical protein
MTWQTLTPAWKTKITADWSAAFPGLGVYKPLHLLRRAGPLLMGGLSMYAISTVEKVRRRSPRGTPQGTMPP